MSNTGYKSVHYRADKGIFQVMVWWRGRLAWGESDDLGDAVLLRNRLERELGKPRSERRILPDGVGVHLTTSGGRKVWEATINIAPGKSQHNTFVASRPGARERALAWRKAKEQEFYYASEARGG